MHVFELGQDALKKYNGKNIFGGLKCKNIISNILFFMYVLPGLKVVFSYLKLDELKFFGL
jgi:hypothetical protein